MQNTMPDMGLLYGYCDNWHNYGIKPDKASPHDMYVLEAVYVDLVNDGFAEFIQDGVKNILELCGFTVKPKGIGYTVKTN